MPLRLARYGVPLAETGPAGLAAAGIEPALLPPAATAAVTPSRERARRGPRLSRRGTARQSAPADAPSEAQQAPAAAEQAPYEYELTPEAQADVTAQAPAAAPRPAPAAHAPAQPPEPVREFAPEPVREAAPEPAPAPRSDYTYAAETQPSSTQVTVPVVRGPPPRRSATRALRSTAARPVCRPNAPRNSSCPWSRRLPWALSEYEQEFIPEAGAVRAVGLPSCPAKRIRSRQFPTGSHATSSTSTPTAQFVASQSRLPQRASARPARCTSGTA